MDQLAPNNERTHCYRCGIPDPLHPPPPDKQIEIVRLIQQAKPPIFWWSEDELALLLTKLRPGDAFVAAFAQSVQFTRCEHREVYAINIDREGRTTRVRA